MEGGREREGDVGREGERGIEGEMWDGGCRREGGRGDEELGITFSLIQSNPSGIVSS